MFKVLSNRDGVRTGVLSTRVADVKTPTFMPDGTRGAVKSLTPEQVRSTGVEVVLANTYHLHLTPGEKTIKALGGLHGFSNQTLPILTDSGGFQVFSLAHVNKTDEEGVTFKDPVTGDVVKLTPEKSIQIQFELGADMMVAFDDVVSLDAVGRKRTREAFDRTHRWLDRSIAEYNKQCKLLKKENQKALPILFGVAQGGLDKQLRKKSLEYIQSTEVGGISVGGLSVGESKKEMYEIIRFLGPLLDPKRPHFLMGVGDPPDMRVGIENGIDMFDCVIPTRNARHGSVWITGDKRLNLKGAKFAKDTSVIDPECDCTTCTGGYSRGFIRHQFKVGEPLAGTLCSIHNIRYLQRLCEEYRD
ncbi:MAG: tRNA guanosine(34) transglycosylase Tgt [bacterium]|nr:tRNA guanosine(34) transglycosylase Tgt [bacterium]